jgi:hypothetical protein
MKVAPFDADITEHVTRGEEVRITACVNNTLSFQSIPPGIIEDPPAGKHYPYTEQVLDYADRQGIVLIDETAAVGLGMGLGGGIFGAQGYQTFPPDTINDAIREVHAQAIRELIARAKSHPSVVLWSITNEPESDIEAAEDYFRPLFDVAPRPIQPAPSASST